jgi:hypothetical protein
VGANDLIIRSGRKTPIHFFLVGRSRALVLPSGRDVGMIHTYRLDLRGGPYTMSINAVARSERESFAGRTTCEAPNQPARVSDADHLTGVP